MKSRQQVARERFKEQHFKNYKPPESTNKNGLSPNPELSKQDFERQVYTAAAALAASTPLSGSKPTSRPNSRPSNSRPVTPAKTGIDEQFRSSLVDALSKEKEKAGKAEKLENNKAEQTSALSAALAAIPQAQKRVEQIPDFSKPATRKKRYRPLAHWSSTPRVAKLAPPPPTQAQAVNTPPKPALHVTTSSSQTKLSPHTPPTIEVSNSPKVRHYTVAHSDVVYSPSDIKLTRPVSRQHLRVSPQSSVTSPRTSFDVQSARNSPRSSMDTNRSLRSLRPDTRPILGRNYNDFSTNSSISDSRSTVGGSRPSELSIPSTATSQESSISSSKSSEKPAKKSSKKFGWGKLASLFGSDPKRAVFALDPDLEEPKPEPPKIVEERAPMLHTLRKENKKKAFNVEKPWKGHKQVFYLNEKERKMYESVWAANKGTHLPYLFVSPEIENEWNKLVNGSNTNSSGELQPTSSENSINTIPTISTSASTSTTDVSINSEENSLLSFDNLDLRQQLKIRRDDIHGYAVARIWRRARLSEDTLAEIWDLVDLNKDGTLDRAGFVVGMWLCDQCLYGRKLPQKVPEEVWNSVDKLHLKVRVQKEKNRLMLVKKLPLALNHTVQGGRHVVKKAVQTATK